MIHILSNISRSKSNHTTKLGQLIECETWNMRNIFLEKTYTNLVEKPLHTCEDSEVGHTSEIPFGIYWWTLKNPKNQNFEKMKKKKIAEVWRYRVRQILFVILGHFLPFTPKRLPPLKPENQNLEKMKNTSGDAIILNCATKNMIKWCVLTQMWSAISF